VLGVGGAVRRGLAPPVAAAAAGRPAGTVLVTVALGLLRKRLVRLAAAAPVALRAPEDMARSRQSRRLAAAERGVALFAWEHPFVDAVASRDGAAFALADLTDVTSRIEQAAGARPGDDGAATRRWVDERVERAWRDIERPAGVVERKRVIDRNLEWLALDAAFAERLGDPDYAPAWLEVAAAHGGPAARLSVPFSRWVVDFARDLDPARQTHPPRVISPG